MKLYVFPHAGGFAGYYLPLKKELSEKIGLVEIYEYYGRNGKSATPKPLIFDALTDQIIEFVTEKNPEGEPFAFLGHSMGAFVAYETAVKMQAQNRKIPEIVFLSGQRPPCTIEEGYFSSDPKIAIPYLKNLNGLDKLWNASEAVQQYFLNIMLYDLSLLESYTPTTPEEDNRLPACVLIHGNEDPELKDRDLSLWSKHFQTIRNEYIFPGGHFYHSQHWKEIANIILSEIQEMTYDI